LIPEEKRNKFVGLGESILDHKSSIPLRSLQKLMGKCISFSLAFPGAKFYIREMAHAIGRASVKGENQLTAGLREELEFWQFLDDWDSYVPWRDEKHCVLSGIKVFLYPNGWAVCHHEVWDDLYPIYRSSFVAKVGKLFV
jgi:hypothetical protein